MDIQNKYKKIFSILNKKFNNVSDCKFDFYLFQYINFLEKEKYANIIIDIHKLAITYHTNKNFIFLQDLEIPLDKKIWLLALFIFKSLNRISLSETMREINYISADNVLNEIISLVKNFYIFYFNKEISVSESNVLRGEFVKIIKLLIIENIVKSKRYTFDNKTIEEWSFGLENLELSNFEHLKISSTPFKIKIIEDNYYLIGDFFTLIKKVFIENLKSNYFFKLKDNMYIERMVNNETYINLDDLHDILQIFMAKGITKEKINESIKTNNMKIFENTNAINKIKLEIKNLIFSLSKSAILEILNTNDFIQIKKFVINLFYMHSCNYLSKYENFQIVDKELFFNSIYQIFISKFRNAYLKLDFKNIEEIIKYKEAFAEYGILLNRKETTNGSCDTIVVEKKIIPENISFLTYIIIYTKKEIHEILHEYFKSYKKNKIIELKHSINLNTVEKAENSSLDHHNFLIFSYIKFMPENEIKIKINLQWNLIKKITNENKELYAEISKIAHIHNIFLLNEYLHNNLKFYNNADQYKNVKIYLLFFFDFRGRFYFDSPISPTFNRFCRLIYNYGVIDINKIKHERTEISFACSEFLAEIKAIKEKFEIATDSILINEIIFWILVAIGKISIDKTKNEIKVYDFISVALKTINNEIQIKNDLDYAEYQICIKILKSLKNNIVIRRCIIKDATASFFQNLIRVLGAKNEKWTKIANLKSTTHWYDWYTFILNEWKTYEKKKKIYNESVEYLFTRKTIKKTIMTVPYSATLLTCFDYFRNDVWDIFKINVEIHDDTGKSFKRFYKFVIDIMQKNGPFAQDTNEIVNHFKKIIDEYEMVIITTRAEDISNLTYYKTKTKHFDFIIKWKGNKKRIIKNYKEIDKTKIDLVKTKTALKANLIHCVDALLIRDINSDIYQKQQIYYMSIHDSFMVDFTSISQFIIIANEQMNKDTFKEEIWKNDKNFFSIFVFL